MSSSTRKHEKEKQIVMEEDEEQEENDEELTSSDDNNDENEENEENEESGEDEENDDDNDEESSSSSSSTPAGPTYKITILGGKSVRGDRLLSCCQTCSLEGEEERKCSLETWTVDQEARFHDKFMLKMLSAKSRAIFFVFSLVAAASTIKNIVSWFETVNAHHTHYFPILVGTGYSELMKKVELSTAQTIDATVRDLAQKMKAAVVYIQEDDDADRTSTTTTTTTSEAPYLSAVQLAVQLIRGQGVSLKENTDLTKGPVLSFEHALSRTEQNLKFEYD